MGVHRKLAAVALVVVLAGCEPISLRPLPSVADRSDRELAGFLPVLADYPGPSWDVTLSAGEPDIVFGQRIDPSSTVNPAGCGDIPFARKDQIAANTEGYVPNGIAGDGGEASVRLMRERPGADLIAESLNWARRCHDFRQTWSGPDSGAGNPTAVSVLAPIELKGIEVSRIHLTDNRDHRFQGEGSRESVVLLAKMRGLVVVGFRHDAGHVAENLMARTFDGLATNHPEPQPLSSSVDTSSLTIWSDHELQRLLPSTRDLPTGWTVEQSSPINRARGDEGEPSSSCDRAPFDHMGWRYDADRDFHEIAAVTATRHPGQPGPQDIVRLAIPTNGSSVIDTTMTWVRNCPASAASGGRRHFAELLPSTRFADHPVTNIHFVNASTGDGGQTASLLQVRGILVVTMPALSGQHGPAGDKVIENLRHANFNGPPARSEPAEQQSEGEVKLPPASEQATRRLARVADGRLVNPEQYHFGGYQPGDASTRSPDYLHFRSPTGSIVCSWRKYALYCEVPAGSFPRTPKPFHDWGDWNDGVVVFGGDSIENGTVATDPLVYAESSVLPYGQTIRLEDPPFLTECLMERDGLTCVSYDTRLGLHLSQQDLTPLVATDALVRDVRPEPNG